MSRINKYAKLLRLPGLGGLAVPPVFGALTVGVYDLYFLSILFIIGIFCAIFAFVLNDYSDVEVDSIIDELKNKPLVSGEIPRKNAITISIFSIFMIYLLIFILWRNLPIDNLKFTAFLCIFTAGILGTIYNLYGKKIPGSDFLVALSMSLVFLFGALSFGNPTPLTWIIFVLTFNQVLFMNAISGGIKDSDHDYKMKVTNIVLIFGVKVKGGNIFIPLSFKIFGLSIRIFSSILVFLPFLYYEYYYKLWHLILIGLIVIGVIYFSFKLLNIKIFDRNVLRKLISSQELLRYYLVPIMLLSIIGVWYSLTLIVLPIIWYVLFTLLIGEKLYKPGRWL